MAAGSGAVIAGKSLPENWSKPVIDSVVLPAHAQTSQCTPITTGSVSNVPLPDRVDIDINVDASGGGTHTITQVTLDLDITHTWIGDLEISLTSPQGTTSLLVDNVCGNTDDMNLTLDDTAGTAIGNSCASPYTGTFNTGGGLNAFIGQNPVGTWVLGITDTLDIDSGTLNSASLNISTTCT